MKIPQRKLISAAITLALAVGSAHAFLERVGPLSTTPSSGYYPTWYQDKTGLAMEFCAPVNADEVSGGWCLIGPDGVTAPEAFPSNFVDEHFYYAASAEMTPATGGRALLVLAVEAAFAAGVQPGEQITFSRIRVRLDNPPKVGTYRFIHPYGEESIEAVLNDKGTVDRIFFTDDVGIGTLGTFDGALNSRLGPYLLPSLTSGGTELAAVSGPASGKLYIADPGRVGKVTGAIFPNRNVFRIEGPAGSNLGGVGVDWIETPDFSLMGRVYTGTLPSKIDVERATYTRDSTGTKVDVFASAVSTTQARLPSLSRPIATAPQLSFFNASCVGTLGADGTTLHPPYSAPLAAAGVTEAAMVAAGDKRWGQIQPAVLPAAVCVKDISAADATGQLVPVYVPLPVTDAVTITEALFNSSAGTLTVAASSSDAFAPPILTLALNNGLPLVNNQIAVAGVVAPPSKVRVLSSSGGEGEHLVRTGLAGGLTPPVVPVATPDSFIFAEDVVQTLAVLANDINLGGAKVTVSTTPPPKLGTAVANPDGTVTYTPTRDANGLDSFTYTATTVGGQSTASVTLTITPVNDAPTVVDDSANAVASVPLSFNVLANDIDPDGAADLLTAVIVTPPVGASASGAPGSGVVTFNAAAAGSYTFTYRAQDRAGATSVNPATVTVQVAAGDTMNITRAQYASRQSRLRINGSVAPAANQTITLVFVNAGGTVLGLFTGTATANALGNWALDTTVALPTGATAIKATSSKGSVRVVPLAIR